MRKIIFIGIIMILTSVMVFADVDDYFNWDLTMNTRDIEVVIRDPQYLTEIYSVYDAWNGIDSNINFTNATYSPTMEGNFTIQSEDLPGSVLCRCEIYDLVYGLYYIKQDIAYFSGSIDKVKVLLDSDLLSTKPTANIERTIMHEIGHGVGLSHPDYGERDYCIMQQTKSYYHSMTITQHDKDNLKAKW